MLKIPSNFTLGGRDWEVRIVPANKRKKRGWLGRSFAATAIIELSSDQSLETMQHTFYHELVHAICATIGYDRLDKDEPRVDAIGNALLQFERTREGSIAT